MKSALRTAGSLADVTYTLPLLVQGLLPQGNLVIATTDGKDVAGHRPADMPDDILKGMQDPEETNKLREDPE